MELQGYGPDDELPDYRKVAAPLLLDGAVPGGRITGQQVSTMMLPEDTRDFLDEDVPFRGPIAEVIDLITGSTQKGDDFVRIGPPSSHLLVTLMNYEIGRGNGVVDRVYWSVSVSTLRRIVDVVRTTLVRLVAEMRAGMPIGAVEPTKEAADNAVSIVVHGHKNTINVQHVSSSAGDVVAQAGRIVSSGGQPESSTRKFTYWLFGLAGVIGTAITVWAVW